MTTEDAKAYLSKREIPQLFESMMTGLMFHRPEDHITYLQDCLNKVKDQGIDVVRWNIFIEQKRRTPLPPITPSEDKGRSESPHAGSYEINKQRTSPLPPIGQGSRPATQQSYQVPVEEPTGDQIRLPPCPIVLCFGGPGSGKATQCTRLIERYPGWVHLSMGDLLRQNVLNKGSAGDKWNLVGDLMQHGEMAPEDVTMDLIKTEMGKNMKASGIIIEGYPRSMEQVAEYDRYIGRVDLAFVMDCEEYYMQQRLLQRGSGTGRMDDNLAAIKARIATFRETTLPCIKQFDDQGKLVIVEADRDVDEIFYDLAVLFDNVFFTPGGTKSDFPPATPGGGGKHVPKPPTAPKPTSPRPGSGRFSQASNRVGSGFARVPTMVEIEISDSGRKEDMPQCPIIIIAGGPGSGRTSICKRVVQRYPNFAHISIGDILRQHIVENSDHAEKWKGVMQLVFEGKMAPEDVTAELLTGALQKHSNATAIILDGYPRNKEQVEQFNKHVGGASLFMLLDCEEHYMQKQLVNRAQMSGRADDGLEAVKSRLQYYKYNTLPVLSHYDDKGLLTLVPAERNEEDILEDIIKVLNETVNLENERPVTQQIGTQDTGRKANLPTCHIVSVIGAPGSGTSDYCQKIIDKYPNSAHIPVAHQSADILTLVSTLKAQDEATFIVLENYPTARADVEQFYQEIGGLSQVIALDCQEEFAKAHCDASDVHVIDVYKQNTLPLLVHFEENGKLQQVSAERPSDEVFGDICEVIDRLLDTPLPATIDDTIHPVDSTNSTSAAAAEEHAPEITVNVTDSGRREELPACHIVSVIGTPGSRISSHCQRILQKFPGSHHMPARDMSTNAVVSEMRANNEVKLLLLENYPQNQSQLEEFNSEIGGMSGVIVLDAEEDFAVAQLGAGDVQDIESYKRQTLPMLSHYDDQTKLQVIDAQKEEEDIFVDITSYIENVLAVPVETVLVSDQ